MGYHDNEATTKKAVADAQRFINDRERYRHALSILGVSDEIIEQVRRADFTGVAAHTRYAGSEAEAVPVFMWCKASDDPREQDVVDVDCACEHCVPLYTSPDPAVPEVAELWCVRIHGPDDVCPAPSKEIAEIGASMFNRVFSGRSEALGVLCRAVVEPWPYGAETHAEDAEKFVDEFILPPEQKSPAPAVPDDLQADARRWRWIRENFKFVPSLDEDGSVWSAPELDELVDTMLAASQAGEPLATHSSWDERYDGWAQMRREAEENHHE